MKHPQQTSQICDLIVHNGLLLTMNGERAVYASGAIAVAGHSIIAVGPERDVMGQFRTARLINANGAVVHPGFIDAHLHINAHTCRGVFRGDTSLITGPGANYADWKAALRPEDERAAAMLGCLELLRHGFTAFIEPGTAFEPDAVADAALATGVRCTLADPYLWDDVEVMRVVPGLVSRSLLTRVAPSRERSMKLLGSQLWRNREPDGIVHGHIALYGEGTASTELLEAAKKLADEHGVICNHHLGFDLGLAEILEQRWGKSRLLYLAENDLLGRNTTLVHMNVIRDADVDPILTSGLSIVWCPLPYVSRGLSLRVPTRMPEMKERGVPVALATDSARSWTVGDPGCFAFHLSAEVGSPLTPGAVLEMKTLAPARAAGMEALLGSLEPGKRADIVIRAQTVEQQPGHDPATQLVAIAHGPAVDTTIINGQVVFRNGHSTRVDEGEVAAAARDSVTQMTERLGLGTASDWPVIR